MAVEQSPIHEEGIAHAITTFEFAAGVVRVSIVVMLAAARRLIFLLVSKKEPFISRRSPPFIVNCGLK